MIGTFIKYIVCDLCINAMFKRMAAAIIPMISRDAKRAVIKPGTRFLSITLTDIEVTRKHNPHDIQFVCESFSTGTVISAIDGYDWFSVQCKKHTISYVTNTQDNHGLLADLQATYPHKSIKRLGRQIVVDDTDDDDMIAYDRVDEIILAATDTKPITRHSFI